MIHFLRMVSAYNNFMQKSLKIACTLWLCVWLSYGSYFFSVGSLYTEYRNLFEYRRLSPDFLPNTKAIQLFAAGHTNTYADILWIDLIQYIGDNIGNGKYQNFTNPLVARITDLHPYFTSTYSLVLILSPTPDPDRPKYEEKRSLAEESLRLWELGLMKTCNPEKIKIIQTKEFGKSLWEDVSIAEPCSDAMLPYNVAYVAGALSELDKSELYYKIASTHKEAPQASRFLGPLMQAKEWEHKKTAEKFLLIGIDGYDESPYTCSNTLAGIITDIKTKKLKEVVGLLPEKESLLIAPKDTKNPLASSTTTCYASWIRAMKQLYLAYITEVSLVKPSLRTGEELMQAWLLKSIPSIREQNGWRIIKNKNNVWTYQEVR